VLPPGLYGRNGVLGIWLPSVDRAGRYSPLTIAAVASTDWAPHAGAMTAFLAASEQAVRDAVEYDLSSVELLRRIHLPLRRNSLPGRRRGGPQAARESRLAGRLVTPCPKAAPLQRSSMTVGNSHP
jgi:hypothetical protein